MLGLEVERPSHFNYQAGDYLFLKCPEISNYEWHPFTISSAPEDKKLVTVHIRSVGSWTGALYDLFDKHRQALLSGNGQRQPIRVPVYLDGPYGTPSSHIFESEVAILIGAGIGVTPFASILKSILHRKQSGDPTLRLKKVHFFWINRGQRSFEWLLELFSKIEAQDKDNFFNINIYLTGTQKKSDMKSSTLFIAMDLLHEKSQVDLITGLKTQTKTGRPNWGRIFREIAQENQGQKVDVFLCGSPGLSRVLEKETDKVQFSYHKENF